jgi:7-cyano-7-deazaguanine synthase in queuosine biosynthesis
MTEFSYAASHKNNSAGGPFYLYVKSPQGKRRPFRKADAVVHLEESPPPSLVLHNNFQHLWPLTAEKQEQVQAFLVLALGVWAADKLVLRGQRPDAWTRKIVLDIPLPTAWAGLARDWSLLLHFLTGDDWSLKPRETGDGLKFAGTWPHRWQPTAVSFLSGGVDSLAGAIDLLEEGHRLILVSHYDYGQLAATQQALAAGLLGQYGPERLHHLAVRVQFEGPELTLRSRSLLYLALGLAAASAFPGRLPLFIPENGWISLNPPLTLNRLGAYSTRTTHPYFLDGLLACWRQAGISQELTNPYQNLTKGEMLAQCRNRSLLKKLVPLSVSCARPVAGRWQKEAVGACGYCYPCLVRRAALHRLGWDRGQDYRVDVLTGSEFLRHRVKGRNLRALGLALKTWQETPRDILARLWFPGSPREIFRQAAAAKRLLAAGYAELAQWLEDQGGMEIAAFLGKGD